ncbi:hypothetical protein C8J57DRAFT_1522534 [Mycena rebaudengoi]|nr:hypothetical protein C8J57DRAFT_1522534 [Mycena rebaudengoi]
MLHDFILPWPIHMKLHESGPTRQQGDVSDAAPTDSSRRDERDLADRQQEIPIFFLHGGSFDPANPQGGALSYSFPSTRKFFRSKQLPKFTHSLDDQSRETFVITKEMIAYSCTQGRIMVSTSDWTNKDGSFNIVKMYDNNSAQDTEAFCTRFLAGKEPRVDALLFTHEYRHVGAWGFFRRRVIREQDEKQREQGALASFLLTTLLLTTLLTAPVERDIRIVNVVNRFYAAAASSPALLSSFSAFSPPALTNRNNIPKSTLPPTSLFLREGARALRTTVLTRHLQRILSPPRPPCQLPQHRMRCPSSPARPKGPKLSLWVSRPSSAASTPLRRF